MPTHAVVRACPKLITGVQLNLLQFQLYAENTKPDPKESTLWAERSALMLKSGPVCFPISYPGNGRVPDLNAGSVSDLSLQHYVGSGLKLGSTRILRPRIGPERILIPGSVCRIGTGV